MLVDRIQVCLVLHSWQPLLNQVQTLRVDKKDRVWYPHLPIFFDLDVLDDIFAAFPVEFDLTARHRLRAKNDMQIEFTYFNFVMERNKQLKEQFKVPGDFRISTL